MSGDSTQLRLVLLKGPATALLVVLQATCELVVDCPALRQCTPSVSPGSISNGLHSSAASTAFGTVPVANQTCLHFNTCFGGM